MNCLFGEGARGRQDPPTKILLGSLWFCLGDGHGGLNQFIPCACSIIVTIRELLIANRRLDIPCSRTSILHLIVLHMAVHVFTARYKSPIP